MTTNSNRIILAVFISPLSVLFGFIDISRESVTNYSDTDWMNLLVMIPFIYFLALIFVLLLGLPCFLLLKRTKLLNFWTLSLSGIPLGYILHIIMGGYWPTKFMLSSFFVSITAALILIKQPDKTRNEMDGSDEPPVS